MNWFTKKRILIISLLCSAIFFIAAFVDINVPVDVCYQGEFCGDISEVLRTFFLSFVSVLIFSSITFKLKESTFLSWRNFSLWVIPLLIFTTFLFPRNTHGMDFFPILRGTVSIVLSLIYSIISLILIFYKSFKKE